jgi:RNA polymerase sigma-70 factor (ECF subfamily)
MTEVKRIRWDVLGRLDVAFTGDSLTNYPGNAAARETEHGYAVELESSLVLIERAQSGDAAALNRLIDRYRPRIVRWASGRLPGYARDLTDTEDLVQDALVGTFRNFQTFQCRGEWALQGYLRRAVLNRIREELRRQKGRPRRDELRDEVAAQELSPLEAAMGAETFARYNAALDTLTEPEREAVIARLELGCSYKEIALLLDKSSEDAARMGVTRAIARVANLMSGS